MWAAVLLMMAALTGLWQALPSPGADEVRVLAQKGEVTVVAGAPAGDVSVRFSRQQLEQGLLMAVDRLHPLPEGMKVPAVRGVRQVVGAYLPVQEGVALTRETIQALCDMQFDRALGDVTVTRGAVSAAQQDEERRKYLMTLLQVCSLEEAARRAEREMPMGGASEHQLGTAFDLRFTGETKIGGDEMGWNETGKWLEENMWRYGFIRRGMPGHEGHESHLCPNVHVRYVGVSHAAAMYAGNWCLEEYLDLLHREGSITVQIGGKKDAWVYAVPMTEAGAEAYLPSPYGDQSADNMGYAIFTRFAK